MESGFDLIAFNFMERECSWNISIFPPQNKGTSGQKLDDNELIKRSMYVLHQGRIEVLISLH